MYEDVLLGKGFSDHSIELAFGVEEVIVGVGDDDGGVFS